MLILELGSGGGVPKCYPDGKAPPPHEPRPIAICRAQMLGYVGWHLHGTECLTLLGILKAWLTPRVHSFPWALWFPTSEGMVSHLRGQGIMLLFPKASVPGCPCRVRVLVTFIHNVPILRYWQNFQRAW